MRVYLDNAATTPIAPEVTKAITEVLANDFGNPSSTHSYGRHVKAHIENSRRNIAKHINCSPSEIVFTSGGTEADNMALTSSICNLGIKRIITSSIEHHAVGHTAEFLHKQGRVKLDIVNIDEKGHVDLVHLEQLLSSNEKTLVSLMHANNEIGNLLPLKEVSEICKKHNAYFHSDTVQTMGHYFFDVKKLKIDFLVCSAHKLHGPKGIGFLYVNKNLPLSPMITGGSQERNHRGGTENLYGIIGLGKAMELAFSGLEDHQKHVQSLKDYLRSELVKIDSEIKFNGETNSNNSLYTVLSVRFPKEVCNSMLLFSLDIHGIASSGGSACSSGSNIGSHVLNELPNQMEYQTVRFSFSRYNTKKEVDFTLDKIRSIVSSG